MTLAQVKANADSYASQIFRVVDEARAEVRWQSEWYGNLSLAGILKLAGTFSLAQLLAHETFRDRYEKGTRVGIHELFYPILQAYDSVVINADVELGGTDQKFNILAGRDLMRDQEIEPQSAMLLPLLPGLDGRKMSKSFGNDIPVTCGADEMFARVMSIADENIGTYQELVLLESGETGENPHGDETRSCLPHHRQVQWLGFGAEREKRMGAALFEKRGAGRFAGVHVRKLCRYLPFAARGRTYRVVKRGTASRRGRRGFRE